jgi:hypothetical protein
LRPVCAVRHDEAGLFLDRPRRRGAALHQAAEFWIRPCSARCSAIEIGVIEMAAAPFELAGHAF